MSANLATRSNSGIAAQSPTAVDPYGQLVDTALDMMRTFDEIISTVDTHSEKYFEDHKVSSCNSRSLTRPLEYS